MANASVLTIYMQPWYKCNTSKPNENSAFKNRLCILDVLSHKNTTLKWTISCRRPPQNVTSLEGKNHNQAVKKVA